MVTTFEGEGQAVPLDSVHVLFCLTLTIIFCVISWRRYVLCWVSF